MDRDGETVGGEGLDQDTPDTTGAAGDEGCAGDG
jgi:hypothetical protein